MVNVITPQFNLHSEEANVSFFVNICFFCYRLASFSYELVCYVHHDKWLYYVVCLGDLHHAFHLAHCISRFQNLRTLQYSTLTMTLILFSLIDLFHKSVFHINNHNSWFQLASFLAGYIFIAIKATR